ncbi:MAG: ubiquinol-cytochrome c reductase cytochrome c1 subunit [Arenicella sp.]|jgi:ubiquinol-cytochrome c reductase cytochrome c1 subunit
MKKLSLLLIALISTVVMGSSAFAAGGHGAAVDEVHMNMSDKASLQSGAKIFVNYCLSCHSAQYSRYNRVAKDLDIPLWQLKENLMFTTEKEGDLMTTTMPAEDAKAWFGVAPPDLSLVARVRSPDWIYTYLRAFYLDESSPSGWNNSLFENVAMPHAMYELQGVQKVVGKVEADSHGAIDAHASSDAVGDHKVVGDTIFELSHPGKLSPAEFDKSMADLTAFLSYMAEPSQLQRKTIGVYTIAFLIILLLLCILLKKEYWRDVH